MRVPLDYGVWSVLDDIAVYRPNQTNFNKPSRGILVKQGIYVVYHYMLDFYCVFIRFVLIYGHTSKI